jgi:hypothetical protein
MFTQEALRNQRFGNEDRFIENRAPHNWCRNNGHSTNKKVGTPKDTIDHMIRRTTI